jgi:uncharacterized membrane protein YccC
MSGAAATHSSAGRSQTIFHLQQAFKLALSMVVYYWIALWVNWDEPQYGGLAIVIVSLGTRGASIEKGILRVVGTVFGVAFGFLILGLFNHDRWATMLAFAVLITVMGYFMQASRYSYAWYAAAFIPLIVWADNYPNFESAFYFGTFRFLTTTAGVLVYTMVDLVFWPRQAGHQLHPLGRDLWAQVREQFNGYRERLEQGQLPEGTSDRRTTMAGTLSRTISTLQDAYFDSPEVSGQKKLWEVWRWNVRSLVDALELWRESIDDCRELDLDRLLPGLGPALDTLEKRLHRIGVLWDARQAADDTSGADDGPLLEPFALDADRSACADLSHFDRAAIMSFVAQLEILNQASRALLQTMQILAGVKTSRVFRISSSGQDRFQPSAWDPERLIHALFPPAAFIAACFFWILMNPPTGPKVPMFAGVLALVLLRTPMNPLQLLVVFVLSIFLAVAPVYWLVMPRLSTGFDLLGLIFIYSFVFGYLGGRSPALKSGPIIMFVMMTGISNEQSYSFQGPVDGALMLLLAGAIITVVYFLFSPLRPEQALLGGLRRFFLGCARLTRGFALDGPSERARGQRIRRRYFQSMVLPAPAKIQTAQQHLDYRLYPDNPPEKVQRLHDSVQSITYRLESLELAHGRLARDSSELPDSLIILGRQLHELLQGIFAHWARLDPGDEFERRRGSLQQLSHDFQRQFDTLTTDRDRDLVSDQVLVDLYATLGSVRGLIEAMANTQGVINEINWPQWTTARF